MNTVLFIKANNRAADQAVSVKLYDAFLQTYQETHPEDQIIELDLFAENLPALDATMFNGFLKSGSGAELSREEKEVTEIAEKYLNQFLESDKVVIAFPLWNFTIPAVLHTYLDYLCRAGKTFRYTAEGPVGLVKDKKVALLNARGGIYSEGSAATVEMAMRHVSTIMNFIGVQDITSIIVEGHNAKPDQAGEIIQAGLEETAKKAAGF